MRIASLTDHINTPSSRFRIRQHIERLAELDLNVTDFPRRYSSESAGEFFRYRRISEYPPKLMLAAAFEVVNLLQTSYRIVQANRFDAIWLSRELMIGRRLLESRIRKPLIYDIDDAIFLNKNSRFAVNALLRRSTVTLAGNEYLAEYCRKFARNVHVVPTAVDTKKFFPASSGFRSSEKFRLGWSGTSSSYFYFLPLERQIADFCESHPDVELIFFADREPTILRDLSRHITFVPWSAGCEADQIRSLDVGIMPIDESEWSKGKCAYKLLVYAASGIPLISSNCGVNAHILKSGNIGLGVDKPSGWRDALEHMYKNRDRLDLLYPDGRSVVCREFSAEKIQNQLEKIFKSCPI